jgi:replication factor C small subunit
MKGFYSMKQLWTEKYRPTKVNDYVFRDEAQRKQVQQWVDSKTVPHLLFSGAPGVGKTTLAKILINELEIDDFDVLEINASRENSVDNVREKITGFVQTMPFGEFKIVLLDEADYISPNGQAALRGVMETYANTARFILTCNYPNKIIPALHSRCQGFHIEKIDHTEFTARIATVCVEEGVEIDIDTLDSYVKATYPDLRKCLNLVQMNTVEGKLVKPQESDSATADYRLAVVDLFKQGKILDARKLLCSQVRPEEMDELFRWMYDNLELWGETQEQKDAAILIIAKGLRNIPLVADQEINLAATLVELCQID